MRFFEVMLAAAPLLVLEDIPAAPKHDLVIESVVEDITVKKVLFVELDAWRCVHMMQGRTSLVLLQVQQAGNADSP